MIYRLLAALCLCVVAFAQTSIPVSGTLDASGSTSIIVKRGSGAPSSTLCDVAAEVGSRYTDSANGGEDYVCKQTGAGTYGWVTIGTVTSIVFSCSMGGGTVTTSSSGVFPRVLSSTTSSLNYTFVANDCGRAYNWTGASAGNWSLPAIGGGDAHVGFYVYLYNMDTTDSLTLTPNGSDTFTSSGGSGAASYVIGPGRGVLLNVSTGVWWARELGVVGAARLALAQTFTATQTFTPTSTVAGINIGSFAGDPSGPVNGDFWYNSTTNKYRCRENGATVDCIGGGGGSSYVGGGDGCIVVNTTPDPDELEFDFDCLLTESYAWTGAHDFSLATFELPNSTTLPGTCNVGELYFDTNATSGARVYGCESANTWVAQGGGGGIPTQITVADTTDSTSFVALFESATGDLGPKTDAGITYNASTGMLTVTGVTSALTGNASTATALAANGSNCSAGEYARGVDASGAAENCTAVPVVSGFLTQTLSDTVAAATTGFYGFGNNTDSTTENTRQSPVPALTVTKMVIVTNTTQSGTGDLVCTLRKDGADQTAMQITIAASTAANTFTDATGTVSFTADQKIGIACANAPAAASSAQIASMAVYYTIP